MSRRHFVPGRLCLLGEHSDWAGAYRAQRPELEPGCCLVAGTDQGLHAEASPHPDLVLESALADGRREGPLRIPADLGSLDAAARAGGFFSYAAGAAAEVRERHGVGGVALRLRSDLPAGRGLSSSAAVCVLVVRALAAAHGLALGVREEMELAFAGERRAGSECGRMDQICAAGQRPSLLHFDGAALEVEALVPGAELHLLVVDLGRPKDTRRILADLNACYPDTPTPRAARVRRALGARNRALVAAGRRAVEEGDARALGAVMGEAQSVFDREVAPVCPELAAPALHGVLEHPAVAELGWGGKGVGSQGDGAAQVVARGPAERDALARRLARELGVRCLPLTLREARGGPARA